MARPVQKIIHYDQINSEKNFETRESMKVNQRRNVTSLTEQIQKKVVESQIKVFVRSRKGKESQVAARERWKPDLTNTRRTLVYRKDMSKFFDNEEQSEQSSDDFPRKRTIDQDSEEAARKLRQNIFGINSGITDKFISASIEINILNRGDDLVKRLDSQDVCQEIKFQKDREDFTHRKTSKEQGGVEFKRYYSSAIKKIKRDITRKQKQIDMLKGEFERLKENHLKLAQEKRAQMDAIKRQRTILINLANQMHREKNREKKPKIFLKKKLKNKRIDTDR